jgi:hypothetical protein
MSLAVSWGWLEARCSMSSARVISGGGDLFLQFECLTGVVGKNYTGEAE